MAYKFTRGSTIQGDIKAADDTQRDTLIDFGEDYIGLETSGSVRMVISGSDGKVGIGSSTPSHKLDINGDIRVRGNDIRDNSGNPAITFDGSANTKIVNNLEANDIVTTSNNDIDLDPDGTGVVIFKGNATKGAGQFKLNCETNSHGITIKGPPHSAAATYTLTLPNNDGDNGQVLQTNGSGVLSWADQSGGGGGGGGLTKTLNSIAGATGDVDHDCSNSSFFHHTNISGNFTPNFTNLNMQNNQIVEGGLILTQGGTGYLPNNFEVDSTGSAIYWEGTAMPTASTNGKDSVDLKITRVSDSYNVFARFSTTVYVAAQGGGGGGSGVSIPNNCLVFLDASDTNSYNGSGTTWTDLSSNSKNGSLINSPTWNGTNKWFEFDGTSGQHVTLPTGFADFTNGATFFFVADLGNGQHWERLVDFSVGGDEINVGRRQSTTSMTLEYYNPSKQQATSNIILDNTLANYVVTTDGSYAKFYRNGTLITDLTYTYLPSNSARSQNYIGKSRGSGADYEGEIAVVAIFNRALTSSEITNLYNHYNAIYSF